MNCYSNKKNEIFTKPPPHTHLIHGSTEHERASGRISESAATADTLALITASRDDPFITHWWKFLPKR